MEDLSLHILDIAQNSIRAGAAAVAVEVVEDEAANLLSFAVRDDGRGMTEEELSRLPDPFFTTRETRRVGLGIPLLKQTAEQAGGGLAVTSAPGKGTAVEARYELRHIDTPPLGDLAATVWTLVVLNPKVEFRYVHRRDGRRFELDTAELKKLLSATKLGLPRVARALRQYIANGEAALRAGAPAGEALP
jgi:hypothetical protein